MRFLLRWQHVAPGTPARRRSRAGRRARAAPGLRGRRGGLGARPARRRRLRHYDPAWLDRLCHDGEVGWLRLTPARTRRRRRARRRAVEGHADLRRVPRRPAAGCSRRARAGADPGEPVGRARPPRSSRCSASAARASPPSSARPPTGCPRTSSARCGTASSRGLLTVRRLRRDPRARQRQRSQRHDRRPPPVPRCCAAPRLPGRGGRTLVARATARGADIDRDELAEAVAELLLHRWGVVFRDLAVHDSVRLPVARPPVGAAPARRPRPGAGRPLRHRVQRRAVRAARRPLEQLTQMRKVERTGERVVRERHRPAQPGRHRRARRDRPAVRTRQVTYVDGVPEEMVVAGERELVVAQARSA